MKLSKETCEILKKPLTAHQRRGKGGTYNYYKGSDIISRLNEAFGHCWSAVKVDEKVIEDQVLLLVELTVFAEGDAIVHQGYGSSQIARSTHDKAILDIGNTYKSAFTNAVKKAAEQFGIGLIAEEDSEEAAPSPAKNIPTSFSAPPQHQNTPTSFSASPQQRQNPSPDTPNGAGRQVFTRPAPLPARGSSASTNTTFSSGPMSAPLPPTGGPGETELSITEPQIKALHQLCSMKGFQDKEADLIKAAIPGTNKSSFDNLLKLEAIAVIRYANTLSV